jgi:O-antigen ligase
MTMTSRANETLADDPLIIDMPTSLSSVPTDNPIAQRSETATFVVLTALLMWAPLAFGTTEPWSQFILRTVALVLFAAWAAQQYWRRSVVLLPKQISLPVLAFVALVIAELLSGSTAYRYATLTESLRLMVYGILMLVAGELFTHRRRLRAFSFALASFGAALAVLSLIQGFSGTDKIFWFRPVDAISASIYGPYVNHNHYAGLMEMLIPLTMGVGFLERGSKQILLMFATTVMTLSVVFSRSRGGMIALAAQLLFVCIVLFRSQRSRRGMLTFFGITALIAGAVFWLGSDKILERFSETQDAYRLKIYRDSITMAMQKPLIGYGLGTFSDVYPAHRTFYTNLFVNHAHNDYLETLVDTGVVGLGLFLWFLAGVFRAGWMKIAERDDPEGRTLTLAALAGVCGIVIHSLLDFNLHIPANAALFFVLCAAIATPFKHRVRPVQFQSWADDDVDDFADVTA